MCCRSGECLSRSTEHKSLSILRLQINAGGQNSSAFVAYDHQLNAEIVIKQIAKARLTSPANFFDESRALYASAHPNVVQIYYACEDNDYIYWRCLTTGKAQFKA